MKLETRKIDSLHEWDKNPRGIKKDAFERLKNQIKELGLYKPFLITSDGTVLGGNMRIKACRDLGFNEVNVSVVQADTEELKLKYALSDNDRAGYYEEDQLAELIMSIPDINLGDYELDLGKSTTIEELLSQFGPDAVEDEPPEVDNTKTVSKRGEVYQLGRHRVMCGDSTKIDDVENLMDGSMADLIFTDPPYNIDYKGKTKERLTIDNDSMSGDQFYEFLLTAFSNMSAVSKSGCPIYICHADSERVNFNNAMINSGWLQKQCIIWDKGSMVLGRQDYHWEHEPILYGWKEGSSHIFYGGRNKTTVWRIPRPTRSEEHPTMKPIKLCAMAINYSSKSDDIVMDLFGGSGSTLIACEQTNRVCNMMELDPKYTDVIRKRYAKFIGKEDEWEQITPITVK